MTQYLDGFHRRLAERIKAELTERMRNLALGSATHHVGEAANTAEKYAAQTSYIQALNDILDLAEQVEKEIYSTPQEDVA